VFSDLAEVRAELKSRLAVPLHDWRIVDEMSTTVDTVVPVLYFEYIEVASSVGGQSLDRQTVACRIDLSVYSAGSDGEDAADAHILRLAHALQAFDDIFWDTARKQRLSNGAYGWKVEATILSALNPTHQE